MNSQEFDDSALPPGPNLLRSLGLGGTWVYKVSPAMVEQIERLGYRIENEELGHGASSVVLLADHSESGRKVAIKVITDAASPHALRQYQREVQVLTSSDLPHGIAPVCFFSSRSENAQPFLVLEWIDGERVVDFVAKRSLALGLRVKLVEQLIRVYAALHAAQWIHGDPSPNNVLVDRSGKIRLIDFGNCRRIAPDGSVVGDGGQCSGTPQFAPSEQVSGTASACVESDMYAVAALAFTILTDEPMPESYRRDQRSLRDRLSRLGVPRWVVRTLAAAVRAPDALPKLSEGRNAIASFADAVEVIDRANRNTSRWPVAQAVSLVSLSLIAIGWGVLARWQSIHETERQTERRITQASHLQQLQRTMEWLRATGHSDDDEYLQKLAEESQRWLVLDLKRVTAETIRELQDHTTVLVQEAVSREQDECFEQPFVQLIEDCLDHNLWVKASSFMLQELAGARQAFRDWSQVAEDGRVRGSHLALRELAWRVEHLLLLNKRAASAKTPRNTYHANLETVGLRLRKHPAFGEVDTLDRAADAAWQSGDFEQAQSKYQEALHMLDLFLAEYETENEKSVRLAQLTEVDFRTVAQMRSQLELVRREKEQLMSQLEEAEERSKRFVRFMTRPTLGLSQRLISQLPQSMGSSEMQFCSPLSQSTAGMPTMVWMDTTTRLSLLEALIEERQAMEDRLQAAEHRMKALERILEEQIRGTPLLDQEANSPAATPANPDFPGRRPDSGCPSGSIR